MSDRTEFNWPRGYKPYERGGRFAVRHKLLLTRRGKVSRIGDTWKTEAGACRAAWRHFALDLGGDQICAAGYPLGQLHKHDGLPCAHWPDPVRVQKRGAR
jgi:hypothetical protein